MSSQESIVSKLVDSFNDRGEDYRQKTALQLAIEELREMQPDSDEWFEKRGQVRDLAFPIVKQLIDLNMLDVFCGHARRKIEAGGWIDAKVKDAAKNGNILLNLNKYRTY